jgi:hypothetical protein
MVNRIWVDTHKPLLTYSQTRHDQAVVEHLSLKRIGWEGEAQQQNITVEARAMSRSFTECASCGVGSTRTLVLNTTVA